MTSPRRTKAELLAALAKETRRRKRLESRISWLQSMVEVAGRQSEETVRQQEATRKILRVIATSPTDVQPVFDAIVESVGRLCGTRLTAAFRVDDDLVHVVAHHEATPAPQPNAAGELRLTYPQPLSRSESLSTRAIVENRVVHVSDLDSEPDVPDASLRLAHRIGYRSLLAVPMIRAGRATGAISAARAEPGPFSDAHIALVQTFASQAVIAMENARLIEELEARNRDLTTAFADQAAIAIENAELVTELQEKTRALTRAHAQVTEALEQNTRLFREIEEKSRQLEAASRHKSEFLSNMSHELRTPLNAIIGFSEVLGDRMFGELTDKQEEYLKDIIESGRHLLSLVNDILDLSKIEAGRMELELTNFDLPEAIDNALTLVRERAGRHGIALAQSVDERLSEIRGDERKVKQVLLNLLSNALKFTPEGGRVDVQARVVDRMAEVSVTDTGVGIAPADQETVFEEFRQVGTAAKKVEGTGLGLALSRKFVELHGGRIWVNSHSGQGSTFTFTIPVARGE
jgi:signal transduction histidine kinase